MPKLQFRPLTTVLIAALVLPVLLGGQALASKNDHRFTQSLEGIRLAHENYCAGLKDEIQVTQDLASDLAGTKEGDDNSALADKIFETAQAAGCKWAR